MFKWRFFFILLVVSFLDNPLYSQNREDSEYLVFETIIKRLVHYSNSSVEKDLAIFDKDKGCFKDINYSDISNVNWKPINHLERILHFSEAYITIPNSFYKSIDLYNIIVKGLTFWYSTNPHSNNWWYKQIQEPQFLGQILINMRFGYLKLPKELETAILDRMKKEGGDPAKWTGANQVDMAEHWIYRACLSNNEKDLEHGVKYLFESVKINRTEGISVDNNFLQHGKQLYMGGYGQTFVDVISKFANVLLGTKYEMPDDKKSIFCKLVRETFFRLFRGEFITYNVVGRNISRKGVIKKGNNLIQIVQRMSKIDPEHNSDYEDFILRLKEEGVGYNIKTTHTHYFYSDYTLHVSPNYLFDIRMVSNRTVKSESLNNENIKANNLSYGSNSILVHGDEYYDIFPVWDWSRIPGVTALHIKRLSPMKPGTHYGESVFAGGVSDSIYGATAYYHKDTVSNVSVKKSWFFFNDEIVCLGSDIVSDSDTILETSINQCLDNNLKPMIIKQDNGISQIKQCEETSLNSPSWILFNGIGYYFPMAEDVVVSKKTQTGSWYDINKMYDKNIQETKNVFYLGIEHGCRIKDGTYAYYIIPGKSMAEEMNKYENNHSVNVVECSSDIHAVYDSKNDILQVIFWRAGSLAMDSIKLKSDCPCALVLKGGLIGDDMVMHIADIGQLQNRINISIESNKISKELACYFTNSGIYAGRTRRYNLQ